MPCTTSESQHDQTETETPVFLVPPTDTALQHVTPASRQTPIPILLTSGGYSERCVPLTRSPLPPPLSEVYLLSSALAEVSPSGPFPVIDEAIYSASSTTAAPQQHQSGTAAQPGFSRRAMGYDKMQHDSGGLPITA